MMSKPASRLLVIFTVTVSCQWLAYPAQAQEPDKAAVVIRLIGVIDDQEANRTQRINACVALSNEEYRDQAARAIPAMVRFLKELIDAQPPWNNPYYVQIGPGLEKVTRALGDMGAAAESAVPDLSRILMWTYTDNYKRMEAADALGKIGSTRALPALVEAARKDKSAAVRKAIVMALKQFAAKNNEAAAVELKIIAEVDQDAGVRELAGPPKAKPEEKAPKPDKMPEEKAPKTDKPPEKEKIDLPKEKPVEKP